MKKEVVICDLCGDVIKGNNKHFKVNLESMRYTDAAGEIDTNIRNFDFCSKCATFFVKQINSFVKIKEKCPDLILEEGDSFYG